MRSLVTAVFREACLLACSLPFFPVSNDLVKGSYVIFRSAIVFDIFVVDFSRLKFICFFFASSLICRLSSILSSAFFSSSIYLLPPPTTTNESDNFCRRNFAYNCCMAVWCIIYIMLRYTRWYSFFWRAYEWSMLKLMLNIAGWQA